MENNLKENKKTIKEILGSLFVTIIGLVCYGYVFNVALRLLNKPNTLANNLGIILLFMLCGGTILAVYFTVKNYKNKSNTKTENGKEAQ